MDKIICPNCQTQIAEQFAVEIPVTGKTNPVAGSPYVANGQLVPKGEKWFLVFEAVATCPKCGELFGFDVWLST